MRDLHDSQNLRVTQCDGCARRTALRNASDVVLMLNLIYHLESPVGALRQAHAAGAPGLPRRDAGRAARQAAW